VTIDPKRIERIWKACPELSIEDLQWWANGERWLLDRTNIATIHAHALICYKIVWWLAKYRKDRRWGMLRMLQSDAHICNVAENDECVCGSDPTEACLKSVEYLLGLTIGET